MICIASCHRIKCLSTFVDRHYEKDRRYKEKRYQTKLIRHWRHDNLRRLIC